MIGLSVNVRFLWGLVLIYSVLASGSQRRHHHSPGSLHASESHPVFPSSLPDVTIFNETIKKFVPRKIWIAVKDRSDELPGHLKELFQRNSLWEVNICDNACKDDFMYTYFANTSIAWAYSVINPLVGAARADIWRYSVLYTFGGIYLDDDSDIKTPFDDIISSKDALIMSEEGASSLGDCYIPTYSLSDTSTYFKFPNFTKAAHYHGLSKEGDPMFFHGHTLVNWGIFTRPRHPLFKRALEHIVEIVTSEYHRQSVVHLTRWDVRWKQVMCTTGFTLTYSLRELELENALSQQDIPRISVNNYREYKGNVKAYWTGADQSHYMKAMEKKKIHILKEFAPNFDLNKIIHFLDKRAVMGDNGKEIKLVKNGKIYIFPSYDVFLGLNFTDKSVRHVSDTILSQIPADGELPKKLDDAIAFLNSPSTLPPLKPSASGQNQGHGQSISTEPSPVSKAATATSDSQLTLKEGVDIYAKTKPIGHLLSSVKQKLDNSSEADCFGDTYDGTRDDYLSGRWSKYLTDPTTNPKDEAVMIFPFCLRTFQLGNTLGYYLNDIACADISGSHFLAVHSHFDLLDPNSLVTKGNDQYSFFKFLPSLIIHKSPKAPSDVKETMKKKCHCLQFCWENSEAPWISRVPLIKQALLPAIDGYRSISNADSIGTLLSNVTDFSTKSFNSFLPLVPNVTIQYRCGDNIGFGKTKYGLLPFSVYRYSNRIPKNVEYIYVIADSPTRSAQHAYSNRCESILHHLWLYLKKYYPNATIIVKRGGDAFLDYIRIAYSQVVFCSASTFCLWPGLSNSHGQVYYPYTPLIAKASDNKTAPHLADNFHWIGEVSMVKEFKHYRPWYRLIDDLETIESKE